MRWWVHFSLMLGLSACRTGERAAVSPCDFDPPTLINFARAELPDFVTRMGIQTGEVIVLAADGSRILRTHVVVASSRELVMVLTERSSEVGGRCYVSLHDIRDADGEPPREIFEVERRPDGSLVRVGANFAR